MFTLYDTALLGFTIYTKAGLSIANIAGVIINLLSSMNGLVYLVLQLCYWDCIMAGYAPTMIIVFIMGDLMICLLGLLVEYVMAVNARAMNRPLLVEEARIGFWERKNDRGEG